MGPLRRLNDVVEAVLINTAAAIFAVFIVVVFIQVIARNYLLLSLVWTDEVALFCFVWSVFLGAAVAVRRRLHYVVEILPQSFMRANLTLRLGATLACLIVIYVLCVSGGIYAGMGMRRFSVSLGLPLFYLFLAIPVSGAAMALFTIELVVDDVRALRDGATTAMAIPEAEV